MRTRLLASAMLLWFLLPVIALQGVTPAEKATLFLTAKTVAVGSGPHSIAVADFNGDGKPDLVTANDYSDNISVLLGKMDGTFLAAVNYPVESAPLSVAVGDFNSDGKLDLAVANWGSGTVSVLQGNGNGTFQTAMSYNAESGAGAIVTADLNGDSKLDLMVANYYSSNVSVLLGNGDGTFGAVANYVVGANPDGVAVGYFNADNNLDVVVANEGEDSVSVLLGNGNGTFQTAVNYGVGSGPASAAVADFNGDGKLDLITANSGASLTNPRYSNDVSVLLGNGDGTFQGAVSLKVGSSPFSVVIGDFNGDGKSDFATANFGRQDGVHSDLSDVSLRLGNGDGTFLPAVNYDAGRAPVFVATGDLNSDGKPDLVVANFGLPFVESNVSVLLGSGGGAFDAARSYSTAGAGYSVAAGDFNGDGKLDLVTANFDSNNVGVLLGKGTGTFRTAVNYPVGATPDSVAVGDFNGDSRLDLVTANRLDGNVSVLLGNGDGTFGTPGNFFVATLFPYSVAVGDFNDDGKQDVAVANGGVCLGCLGSISVLLGKGDGTFGNSVALYEAGGFSTSVAAGDLNRDGKLDLAVADFESNLVSVLLGNGDGTFQKAVPYTAGGGSTSVTIADFNGDGNPDLVVANSAINTVSVLLGNGDGSFSSANYAVGESPQFAAAGDFNGDGKPDLAVANAGSDKLSVLWGNGDGSFQAAMTYGEGPSPWSLVVGDFNGDGAPDLAATNTAGASPRKRSLTVLLNTRGTVGSVTSSPNPSLVGQAVTFTANVRPSVPGSAYLAGKITGTVTFHEGSTILGSATLVSGYANLVTSSLSPGVHTITAVYPGDSNFNAVTSPPLIQTVQ